MAKRKKKRSGERAIIALASFLGIAGAFVFKSLNAPAEDSTAFIVQASPVPAPTRLVIPSLGIDTGIQPVGITASGTMDVVHSYSEVGWFADGPRPGEAGNAIIEGHLDTAVSPQAIFYNLSELKSGDAVEVESFGGSVNTFIVTGSALYPYDEAPTQVFGPTDGAHLNLVTCGGTWIKNQHVYDERLVVFTEKMK